SGADLDVLRLHNDVVNRMAANGEIPGKAYSSVQKDFEAFNKTQASIASQHAGMDLTAQKPTKDPTPMTDSDYINAKHSPTKQPVDPKQIRMAIDQYNADMNKRFKTDGVNYAKKFDTDFMADPHGMSAADFTKVGKMNNDPYFNRAAAEYEFNKRHGLPVTEEQSQAYLREMQKKINEKTKAANDYRGEATQARVNDSQGTAIPTRDLDAKQLQKMQQQSKYIDRINGETERLAGQVDPATRQRIDERGLNVTDNVKPPANPNVQHPEDLTKLAADRGVGSTPAKDYQQRLQNDKLDALQQKIDERNRITGKEPTVMEPRELRLNIDDPYVRQNLKNASSANALNDSKLANALMNNASVKGGLANQNLNPEQLRNAAELGNQLKPAQQNQLIDDVRLKYGDTAARNLTTEMRNQKIANVPETTGSKFLKAGGKAINTAGDVMLAAGILNTGQDVKDWMNGTKSGGEVVKNIADIPLGGLISTGEQLDQKAKDYLKANRATDQANQSLQNAYVMDTGKALRQAGVNSEETRNIMKAMANGDQTALQNKLTQLQQNGQQVKLPAPPEKMSVTGDDTVWERTKQVGTGMKDGLVRAGGFAKDTATDTGGMARDLLMDKYTRREVARQLFDETLTVKNAANAMDAYDKNKYADQQLNVQQGQRDQLVKKLVERGMDPLKAQDAVDDFRNGNINSVRDLRDQIQNGGNDKNTVTKIDDLINNSKNSDDRVALGHIANDLQYGNLQERETARQKLQAYQQNQEQLDKQRQQDLPSRYPELSGDDKQRVANVKDRIEDEKNPERRSKLADIYQALTYGDEQQKQQARSDLAHINDPAPPTTPTAPAGGMTATSLTGTKPIVPETPPEPPPDPDADKKRNLQNYADNMQNGSDAQQQKIDALQAQIKASHNSSEKRDLQAQIDQAKKDKDDYDQRVATTKQELNDLGVKTGPTGPSVGKNADGTATADGYTAGQLSTYANNMQNGSDDRQQKINDLQAQINASHNSAEKRDLQAQLAQQQKDKDDYDQRLAETQKSLAALGVNPSGPGPTVSTAADGTPTANGYTANQLNNYLYNMQNGSDGKQQKINDLQAQIDASHNSAEKKDLLAQIAQQQKDKDDYDQRITAASRQRSDATGTAARWTRRHGWEHRPTGPVQSAGRWQPIGQHGTDPARCW
ncbi:MAG: hypothetical protein NTY53_17000, partial [Kiritimatiellaeota bacterium]|nr:hypothetical protein [Kiritimatiellota bacterium]